MKNKIFKIFIIFFLILGNSKIFSQETYKLEISFDLNEDGGGFSDSGDILAEYNIRDENNNIIGSLMLNAKMDKFEYFNTNKKLVAYSFNTDKNNSPFDNKNRTSYINKSKSPEHIFSKKWNPEKDRFDLFSNDDILIGKLSLNQESGIWEIYRIDNRWKPSDRIFSNYFKINSEKKSFKKVVDPVVSGRVVSSIGGPLYGATVKVSGTSRSTTTDFNGNFTINASQGDKLFVSKLDYKYDFITVGYSKFYDIRLTPKIKKEKRNKRVSSNYPRGLGIVISKSLDEIGYLLEYDRRRRWSDMPKLKFGVEYLDIFGDGNSVGINFGFEKSDTRVSDLYNLYDYDLALTYGYRLLNFLKLKAGLGYYTYNFNTTESFGDFYDYDGGPYYSLGIQLYIPFGDSGILLETYYDNTDYTNIGIGYKF